MGPGPVFPLTLSDQLSIPEPVNSEGFLWQRFRKRGNVEMFAKELTDSTQEMSTLFPQSQPPLKNHVCILVEFPSSELMAIMLTIGTTTFNR